jgi:outer membrane protein assembly factor BamB
MNSRLLRAPGAKLTVLFCLTVADIAEMPIAHAADWFQFGFDAAHSSYNDQETSIGENLNALQLLYQAPLPSAADGAPVYLSGVTTASGQQNVLFLTTKDGHIVALDADTGAQIWLQQPASGPAPKTASSPAIDPNRQFVYSFGLDGKVHKFGVGDGTEVVDGRWPEVATLKPEIEKSSSALTFATAADGHTYLYATTSNMAYDEGDYQGHITSIDLSTGAQTVFNTLCSNRPVHFTHEDGVVDCPLAQSGVWTRPAALYNAANDRLYIATGNGPYTGNVGGFEWGESVLALSPSLRDFAGVALTLPLDSYTPAQFEALNDADMDLGVSVPAIIPAPADSTFKNIGVQIGKDAIIRLLNLDDLSGAGAPGHLAGEISQVTNLDYFGFTSNQSAVWVDPQTGIAWYLLACQSTEYGFMVTSGLKGGVQLVQQWTRGVGGTGGGSPVIADGVEFVVEQHSLVGLDPKTGQQLWAMPITGVHWASPIVADGKIFLADGNATVSAYGVPASINQMFRPGASSTKPRRNAYRAPVLPTQRGNSLQIP